MSAMRFGTDGWVGFDGEIDGFTVWVLVVVDQNGTARCGGLRIEPDGDELRILDIGGLRTLKVERLVRRIASMVPKPGERIPLTHLAKPRVVDRPRGGSDEHLRSVAAVWKWGQRHGDGGTRTVEDEWGVGRKTAELWVRQARQAGHLPEWKVGG